jgi:hypothetical protein
VAICKIDRRREDHLVTVLYATVHLDRGAKMAHDIDWPNVGNPILDHRNAEPVTVEDERV